MREYRSIDRLRRRRMAAREKAAKIREGIIKSDPTPFEPAERELEDIDYYNMIMDLRAKRGVESPKVKPAPDKL